MREPTGDYTFVCVCGAIHPFLLVSHHQGSSFEARGCRGSLVMWSGRVTNHEPNHTYMERLGGVV